MFYFLFWFLHPIVAPLIHPQGRNSVDTLSFSMLFVPVFRPTSAECPSMFSAITFYSFLVFSSKGWCFLLVNYPFRHTHLVLHVPVCSLCAWDVRKLPLHPPLLFKLPALCLTHWLSCFLWLHFAILPAFRCLCFSWCDLLFLDLLVVVLRALDF